MAAPIMKLPYEVFLFIDSCLDQDGNQQTRLALSLANKTMHDMLYTNLVIGTCLTAKDSGASSLSTTATASQ
jgi:hypothetical protein